LEILSLGRHAPAVAALFAGLFLAAGCSAAGSEQQVGLLEVDVPLREPSWIPGKEALLAPSEDRRQVVRVDVGAATPGSRAPIHSEKFEDIGENLAVNFEDPDLAYLPRPDAGEISTLDTDSLRVVDEREVGDSPGYVTLDVQSEILFALSEGGSRVSAIEIEASGGVPPVEVGVGSEALIEAPEKGLEPAFWTAGPGGVSYYHGDPPERLVGQPMEATDIAVDLNVAQRAYVAEGDRVVALEGDPEKYLEGDLVVTATRSLGEQVEHVASDELHVFAATEEKLVAMRREGLEVVESVEFGRLLEREGKTSAGVSGIAVGAEDVYLTLEGEPYVLRVKKP
jgi:hypothetical protein